jgi:hypothetical protein
MSDRKRRPWTAEVRRIQFGNARRCIQGQHEFNDTILSAAAEPGQQVAWQQQHVLIELLCRQR